MLDIMGQQYSGTLLPGPTAMVLSLVTAPQHTPFKKATTNDVAPTDVTSTGSSVPKLQVECMTDEFCHLLPMGSNAGVTTHQAHGPSKIRVSGKDNWAQLETAFRNEDEDGDHDDHWTLEKNVETQGPNRKNRNEKKATRKPKK
jgi:hypothetical protein